MGICGATRFCTVETSFDSRPFSIEKDGLVTLSAHASIAPKILGGRDILVNYSKYNNIVYFTMMSHCTNHSRITQILATFMA